MGSQICRDRLFDEDAGSINGKRDLNQNEGDQAQPLTNSKIFFIQELCQRSVQLGELMAIM